jgi:hypothetical protein
MTGNLTTHELVGIAIGQTRSNSVPKGQGGYDDRYLDGIHDLVSEEEERQRSGGSLQVKVAGMLQELDDIYSLQSSRNKSSSSGTPNTSNQGDHECGRHDRRGFLNSEQVDHQASNRSYMPSECTVSRTEMTSIQHWYSESRNRMPWCPIPLRGDPSAHRPQCLYRGSGESEGTVQMRAETWAYQEENEQDIHAKWSTEGTYGFSER